jgi:hypothetical protein
MTLWSIIGVHSPLQQIEPTIWFPGVAENFRADKTDFSHKELARKYKGFDGEVCVHPPDRHVTQRWKAVEALFFKTSLI